MTATPKTAARAFQAAPPLRKPPTPGTLFESTAPAGPSLATDLPVPKLPRALTAVSSAPTVQRKCVGCADEDKKVRRRPAEREDARPQTSVQPTLEVGPAGDHYEREADAIAARVMSMPGPVTPTPAAPRVQRACVGCSDDKDKLVRRASMKDDEEAVRPRRAPGAAEAPRIAASSGKLTSGGRPLPDHTRTFFEERMGRDLSAVRVHEGRESASLNDSIRARAFTYSNHVWLGAHDRAEPTTTMAHELAHVMQQTQPGPLSPEGGASPGAHAARARPAPRRVMRSELKAFWVEKGVHHKKALPYNTAIHNAAVKYLREDNNLISEAPIPGGSKKGSQCGLYGFADLVRGAPTVGVERVCKNNEPPNLPVRDFGFTVGRQIPENHKAAKGKNKDYKHDDERAPRIEDNKIAKIGKAAKKIQIGDMKPGHNISARAEGIPQINNYVKGIKKVRDAVNNAPDSMKKGVQKNWNLDVGKMTSRTPMKIRDTVHPKKLKGKKKPLRMHFNGEALIPDETIMGQMVIAKDVSNPGVYVYLWVPTTDFRGVTDPKIVRLGTRLETEIVKPLKVSPLRNRVSRLPQSAPPRATPSRRRVRRRKSKERLADSFRHDKWTKQRGELTKRWPKGLLAKSSKVSGAVSKEERASALRGVGAMEAAKQYAQHFKDGDDATLNVKGPKEDAQSKAFAKTVKKLEFWLSFKGRAMGMIRRVFGRAFVTGHNAFLKLKEIFERKRPKGASRALTIVKAALAGLLKLLGMVGGAIVRRTGEVVAGAVVSCAEARIRALFAGEIEAVEAELNQFEVGGVTIKQLSEMDETALATHFLGAELAEVVIGLKDGTIAEKLFGPFSKNMEAIKTAFDGLSTAATVAEVIQWAIRVVACMSPPAVGCLWLVAESALSWAFSMFVKSCWFLKKLYPHVAKLPVVNSLANSLAGVILGKAKEVLPKKVLGGCNLDAAKEEAAKEKPDISDVTSACTSSGRQPTAAELALAEKLSKMSSAKLAVLKEIAEAKGWKGGTQIPIDKADEFIKWVESTDIDKIRDAAEIKRTGGRSGTTKTKPSALKQIMDAVKKASGEKTSSETVEESVKRKGGGGTGTGGGKGDGEGPGTGGGAGKGPEAGGGGGKTITKDTTGKGPVKGGKDVSHAFEITSGLNMPASFGSGVKRTVGIDIHAMDTVFSVTTDVVLTGKGTDDNGPYVSFYFKKVMQFRREFDDGSWVAYSPKPLGRQARSVLYKASY